MVAAGELAPRARRSRSARGTTGSTASGWVALLRVLGAQLPRRLPRRRARAHRAARRAPLAQKDLVKRALGIGERMFLRGEIERREALSSRLFENAVLAFVDQGYVNTRRASWCSPSRSRQPPRCAAIEGRIAGYWGAAREPAVNARVGALVAGYLPLARSMPRAAATRPPRSHRSSAAPSGTPHEASRQGGGAARHRETGTGGSIPSATTTASRASSQRSKMRPPRSRAERPGGAPLVIGDLSRQARRTDSAGTARTEPAATPTSFFTR